MQQLGRRLAEIGVRLSEIDAILLTHEHRDHLAGIKVLHKHYPLPLYLNQATRQAAGDLLPEQSRWEIFNNGERFRVGDLTVEAFSISHDTVDPVGYVIHNGTHKVAIATDLGYVTNLVREKLKAADLLVLESNHDLEMLKNCPYPWPLKQRVWGRQGHLSNAESASLLRELCHPKLQHVVLAHLSETNNQESLVRNVVQRVLTDCASHEVVYSIASQDRIGQRIHLV